MSRIRSRRLPPPLASSARAFKGGGFRTNHPIPALSKSGGTNPGQSTSCSAFITPTDILDLEALSLAGFGTATVTNAAHPRNRFAPMVVDEIAQIRQSQSGGRCRY